MTGVTGGSYCLLYGVHVLIVVGCEQMQPDGVPAAAASVAMECSSDGYSPSEYKARC